MVVALFAIDNVFQDKIYQLTIAIKQIKSGGCYVKNATPLWACLKITLIIFKQPLIT